MTTVSREFTNELGNAIRIVIEGPTSTSENVVTPMESAQLLSAMLEHAVAHRIEWQIRRRYQHPWHSCTQDEAARMYKVMPNLVRAITVVEGAVPCSSQ